LPWGRYDGRPLSFKKGSSLVFTPDAIVDLLQELIDIAAVADAIQNEVAQIFTIDPGRAARILLGSLEAVRDEVTRSVASIVHVLGEELAQESPSLHAVGKEVAQVLPAPNAIFEKVAEIVAAFKAVANKIADMAASFHAVYREVAQVAPAADAIRQTFAQIVTTAAAFRQKLPQIATATAAFRQKLAQILASPQTIPQKITESFAFLETVLDKIAQILSAAYAVSQQLAQLFPCGPVRGAIAQSMSGHRRHGCKAKSRGGKHKRSSPNYSCSLHEAFLPDIVDVPIF